MFLARPRIPQHPCSVYAIGSKHLTLSRSPLLLFPKKETA
jgi:hypothetical protein